MQMPRITAIPTSCRSIPTWYRTWYSQLQIPLIILVLAGQYSLWQAVMHVQYDDASRNLHWGLYTAEQPRFLLTAIDYYARGKGFPPNPLRLAPLQGYGTSGGVFHPWWGPAFLLLFAGIWSLTHSYNMLQQIVPLATGLCVLLVYRLGIKLAGATTGWLAAGLFALMPLVREYGVISYVECLSALAVFGALWCFVEQRTVLAVVLGSVAVLCKRDTAALYLGSALITMLWDYWRSPRTLPFAHTALALGIPALAYIGWIGLTWQRPPTVLGGFSFSFFLLVIPQMVELFFYIPWFATLPTLALLGWLAYRGARRLYPSLWTVALVTWLVGGIFVLLIYAGTHGAGNSPRVFIPAFPPLALLAAAGLTTIPLRWRKRFSFYLVSLFLTISVFVTVFQFQKAHHLALYQPAFTWLRTQPQGFVLTDAFWEATLYAQQPATWFEFDATFEHNIMWNRDSFGRYVSAHHIRYVILPAGDQLAAPEVRQFLTERGTSHLTGTMVTYSLY